ncbi:MAG: hypothetical protein KTM48_01125, partial [Wolbachia endosymbiont of Pissodes strobi]|nr:hypothetical protein [Wolbachia endosymbiont of Pissodes strobi]
GCFQAYRTRFKAADIDTCIYCGEIDTVEHTFFECDRWVTDRTNAEIHIGKFSPDNVVNIMLRSKENWDAVCRYAKVVIDRKERDIRLLQRT